MKFQFFSLYNRFKKPIIFASSITLIFVVLNQWLEYKAQTVDSIPWVLASVETGDRFTVVKKGQNKSIKLCGVSANGENSTAFLESVINLGDGTVELEKVGSGYEAWILIDKDYDTQLVKHISDKPNELVEAQIHLNTWMIERGYAKRDLATSDRCRDPDALLWAEKAVEGSSN